MRALLPLAFSFAGCLVHPSEPKIPAPDTRAILQLIGRWGAAHACPIAEDSALTAAHVVDVRPFDKEVPLYPQLWTNGYGETGALQAVKAQQQLDGATLEPEEPFAHFYSIADKAPEPGEWVWFVGYDFEKRDQAFTEHVFKVRVLRVVAHHLILSEAGKPGSSGSCVLNAKGEVVGVNTGGMVLEDHREVGMAVGVWRQ